MYRKKAALLVGAAHWLSASALPAAAGLSFPGISQSTLSLPGNVSPQVSGAIGPASFAEFVNGGFGTFDRATGAQQSLLTDQAFWLNAGIPSSVLSPGITDPRVTYDASTGRWFAVELTKATTDNKVLLAVSSNSDPFASAGHWNAVSFTGNAGAGSSYRYVDYPTLGVDANGVYIATTDQSSSVGSSDNSNSLFSIPKRDLIAVGGPVLTNMTRFNGSTDNADTLGALLQPVTDLGGVKSRAVIIAQNNQNFGQVNRTDLLGTSSVGATMSSTQVISVQDTRFANSPRQPDHTGGNGNSGLDSLDDRYGATIYQVNDLAYMVHTIGFPINSPSESALRWTVLRVSDNSTQVVQEGTIVDANFDYFQPSICANAYGEVVIGYNRSGPNGPDGDINSFFSVGTTDSSGKLNFGTSQQASFSTISGYHNSADPDVWTQYAAVTPDPLDAHSFWLVNKAPVTSSTWGTEITQITVPEPDMTGFLSMTCLLLMRKQVRGSGSR